MSNENSIISDAIASTLTAKELSKIELDRYLNSNDPSVAIIQSLNDFGMKEFLNDDPSIIKNPAALKIAIQSCKNNMMQKQSQKEAAPAQTIQNEQKPYDVPAAESKTSFNGGEKMLATQSKQEIDMSQPFVPGRGLADKIPGIDTVPRLKSLLKTLGY